jgi:hypothetical protein
MSKCTKRVAGLFSFALATAAIAGCGGQPATAPTEISLRKLASYYGMFMSSHKGTAPANEAELRTFIKEKAADADLDELFRSVRDRQPYIVIYFGPKKVLPSSVIAYEKEGQAGKRFVAYSTTAVRELDDAEFKLAVDKR